MKRQRRKFWVIRPHDIVVRLATSKKNAIEKTEEAIAAYAVGSVDLGRIAA